MNLQEVFKKIEMALTPAQDNAPEVLLSWQGQGEAVITLSCNSLEEMQSLQANTFANGLNDAG